jgi:bifunctional DNase/RNase
MIRVTVDSIRVSLLTQHRVVVLREVNSRRYLPIWIGPDVADAIAVALQGHEPPRPLTHDLLKATISDLGATIVQIVINDIQDQTFYARIMVNQRGREIEIDSRPSDAIALAVRTDVPIYVADHVMDQVGLFFDEEEQPAAPAAGETTAAAAASSEDDDNLSLFRDFINTLDLKDPDKE